MNFGSDIILPLNFIREQIVVGKYGLEENHYNSCEWSCIYEGIFQDI